MNIDVEGGTAKHGEDLCQSCRFLKRREDAQGRLFVYCITFERHITQPTVRCNQYYNKNQPNIHEMVDIAWILTTDVHGRKIGFRPFRELSHEEQNKHRIPGY